MSHLKRLITIYATTGHLILFFPCRWIEGLIPGGADWRGLMAAPRPPVLFFDRYKQSNLITLLYVFVMYVYVDQIFWIK